mmetsp:Transcript_13108/g.11584  ORF Transcript_13108/g.11584 Transcript_13108/m.11584 type:complete len:213 (-) Transcript_13108:52-690(-)
MAKNVSADIEKMSLYDLINQKVIPKWIDYMQSKTDRNVANPKNRPRTDTFRKKIIRDIREFYRILFRVRFHYLEYKTKEGIYECMTKFFKDLKLEPSQEDMQDFHLFRFVHQTHLHTSVKCIMKGEKLKGSPFHVIEKYNEDNYRRFLNHPLCAKMFYFVMNNFMDHYYPLVINNITKYINKGSNKSDKYYNKKYKIIEIISKILNCYKENN